ncbi:MAG: hypothetical protein ACOVK2_04940 [Candidatus Fonsibacter sp.]
MRYFIPFLLILLSCTPQRRFDRLVKKYPYLLTSDTLIVKDTIRDTIRIVVPEVQIDTIVNIKELYDTVTVEKDRIKVKVWRVKDKVYINGKCDTIYIEKPIERIVYRKIPIKIYEKTPWYKTLLNNILGILLILLVIYTIYKFIK